MKSCRQAQTTERRLGSLWQPSGPTTDAPAPLRSVPFRSASPTSLASIPSFSNEENTTSRLPLQRKLSIGSANDPLEAEADAIAERVLKTPAHGEPRSRGTGSLQRSPSVAIAPTEAPAIVHDVLRSPGRPLDTETRAFFEPRFGRDLSDVRVHTDEQAAESARAVNARAYTVGQEIVFGANGYSPQKPQGRQLLAHELSHVLQQRSGADGLGSGPQPTLQRAPEDEASAQQKQVTLPPKGINPEADLPRSPMEEAKLNYALSGQRYVITFILGPLSDPFYKSAYEYWRQEGRTNILVTNKSTLTDVLNYLMEPKNAPPFGGRSWGQINLIVHANEEGGLGFKLAPDSPNNMDPEELEDKIKAGGLPKVDGTVIDRNTAINVHGCAIGRNPQMMRDLSQAFSGALPKDDSKDKAGGADTSKDPNKTLTGGPATVYGPKDLQGYSYSGSGASEKTDEFLIEYWAVGYPSSETKTNKDLVKDFDDKFGTGPGVDWGKAIGSAHRMKMPYYYDFTFPKAINVPGQSDRAGHARLLSLTSAEQLKSWTKWSVGSQSTVENDDGSSKTTITYNIEMKDDNGETVKGTVPLTVTTGVPQTNDARNKWIQTTLGAKAKDFSWTFVPGAMPQSGTAADVTLRAIGSRNIVRIERELKDETGAHEHPSREDTAHYGSYKPP